MEDRRIADYFVVAGLPDDPEPLDDNTLSESGNFKASHGQAPITDISVIFPSLGEKLPEGWEAITKTQTGLSADLNHGSLRTPECYLCIKRGRDKPPLVDIGIMYEGKEYLLPDAQLVKDSVGGHLANVNNSTSQTFITYRRGTETMPCNALVVTDICIVIASKGESPPHAFCCIQKNLNKGIVGSDVFLCYKKSMNRAKLLTYNPAVLSRFPSIDYPDFPFPNSVPLFCLPMGATLELWPVTAAQPKPLFSTFVLTVSDAKYKVYGFAVTFYERFPKDKLSPEQKELLEYEDNDDNFTLNVNKSICLLSHFPFSLDFQEWLLFLHSLVQSSEPQPIPVERYISQLLYEIPFPSPRILLQLPSNTTRRVILTQPEDLPLPRNAASFKNLLLSLGSDNCLLILLLALTEQKILIHSLRPDTLTSVAEAVSTLLFPFKWQCPYIPLCPLGLVEVLHAPLPFLMGVDSRFFDLYEPPADVSCIDLDTNIITVPDSQKQILTTKLLPKRPAKILKSTLDYLHYQIVQSQSTPNELNNDKGDDIELELQRRRRELAQELEIQEAFLKFMVHTLKGYRTYLLPITKAPTVGTTDPQALFQLNDFLKSRDKSHHKFFHYLINTQMFIRFIEERSFVADGDQDLAFFDECIEKVNDNENSDYRLIELDIHKNDRTVFVLPPEPPTPGEMFTYDKFDLNPQLLGSKKKNHLGALMQGFGGNIPGSPMARRTKHEIKSAQKLARKCLRSPELWARLLSGTCHTLYFMILPSMLFLNKGREKAILQQAHELLVRATRQRLACDEVCYRLMMQLCGEHSRPLLAVKLLLLMKKFGIQLNALTYGLYNRCVLEAEWPAHASSSQVLWNKLRNVVIGAAHFRWAAKQRVNRKLSASTEGGSSLLDVNDRTTSRSSLDSHDAPVLVKLGNNIVRDNISNGTDDDTEDMNENDDGKVKNLITPESPECRILSRMESAGDANILDKLNKKNCSRSLLFNGEQNGRISAKNSPKRQVVTENDPLGAFIQPPPTTNITPPVEEKKDEKSDILTDEPVLFRNSFHRSATFEGSPPSQNKIHRSETVPASTVASSLASLGNTFKMGFGRYSPSRISIRKADLKVPQQFIENALTTLSPSLTGKKSNELIQGGISSIKSAATTMVKKLDELKEAISTSANSTPVKAITGGDRLIVDGQDGDCDSNDGSDIGERHRRISAELGSYRGSVTNLKDYEDALPDCLYAVPNDDKPDSELNITLTTCSECHNCSCLIYDEDIMANWTAEDSNLNTVCPACNKPTVPFLTVTIENNQATDKSPVCDPFSIPYLNPLVLRKELENILSQEGDLSLSDPKFVDEHPIIYWNLVWAFERINVQTHLPSLYLKSTKKEDEVVNNNNNVNDGTVGLKSGESTNAMQPVEEGTDPLTLELAALEQQAGKVNVRCLWDEPRLHNDRPPMYILWKMRDTSQVLSAERSHISKSFMQKIIYFIRQNDLEDPLKSMANERETLPDLSKSKSIYRDILFLACKVLGRDVIDVNMFDKQYTNAYTRVTDRNGSLYGQQDKPISLSALYCRQYFRPLTLP